MSARQHVWLVVGMMVGMGSLWQFPPLISRHINRAEGYKYLNQALEILGDQNPEPDFCVAGGVENAEALRLVHQALVALEAGQSARGRHDAQTLLLLGRAHCLAGQIEEAIAAYKGYTKLRPGNPLGHLELGFGYAVQNQIEASLLEWKQANISAQEFYLLGLKAKKSEPVNLARALQWFERAIRLEPGSSIYYYHTALIYQQLTQYDLALQILEDGIEQSQSSVGVSNLYYQKGFILQYNQEPPDLVKAWEMYQIGLDINDFFLDPSQAIAIYHHRGSLYTAQKKWQEAIHEYNKALELDPGYYWAHLGLANVFWQTGQKEQAFAFATEALALNPDPSLAYVYLGDFYLATGAKQEAVKMYQKALEYAPNFTRALNGIQKASSSP